MASFSQDDNIDDNEQYTFNLALEIISRVLPLNTVADICNMQDTLGRIIGNIIKEPTNLKFRALKLQNKTLRSKFFDLHGAKEIMFIMGFHKTRLSDEEESLAMILPLDMKDNDTNEQIDGLSSTWSWLDVQLKTCLEMATTGNNATASTTKSSSSCCAECILKIQLPKGFLIKGGFFSEEPLSAVVDYVTAKRPVELQPNEYGVDDRVWVLSQSHPSVIFSRDFLNQSLSSLNLTPRATLIAHLTEPNLTPEEIKRRQEDKIGNAMKKVIQN